MACGDDVEISTNRQEGGDLTSDFGLKNDTVSLVSWYL